MTKTDVICPDCGVVIGQSINIDGLNMLLVGEYLLRDSHGTCYRCRRTFYWYVSDPAINKVNQRSLRWKNKE